MRDLLANHRLEDPVAVGADRTRSAAELLDHASSLAARLPPATPGSRVCFVFDSDRYAFAVALFAAWQAGHSVLLPTDASRAASAPFLDAEGVVTILHDRGAGRGLDVAQWLEGDVVPATRRPLCVPAELARAAFEAADRLLLRPGERVVATLSPTHPVGLVPTLLAPLAAGCSFVLETPREAGSIEAALRGASASLLIGVPAHLRRVARLAGTGPPTVRAVVCVLGQPDRATRECLRARFRCDVVAWPDDAPDDAPREAPVASPAKEADVLADRLLALDGVDDAAVVALPATDGKAKELLVVVVAPRLAMDERDGSDRPDGSEILDRFDRSIAAAIAASTRASGAEVTTRRVPELVRDANGQLAATEFFALFQRSPNGAPQVRALAFEERAADESGAPRRCRRFTTRLPEGFVFFEGHFPGHPVLPAAVQVEEIVLPCVRRSRPGLGALTELVGLKFIERIVPRDELDVVLRWNADEPVVSFEIVRAGTRMATGSLRFASALDGATS